MEIEIKDFFFEQLSGCTIHFRQKFRKIYQQLKIVDHPLEIKGVTKSGANLYKLTIARSTIGINYRAGRLYIVCFLHNEFLR